MPPRWRSGAGSAATSTSSSRLCGSGAQQQQQRENRKRQQGSETIEEQRCCAGCRAAACRLTAAEDGWVYCDRCWKAYYGKPPPSALGAPSREPSSDLQKSDYSAASLSSSVIPAASDRLDVSVESVQTVKAGYSLPACSVAAVSPDAKARPLDVKNIDDETADEAVAAGTSAVCPVADHFARGVLELRQLCGTQKDSDTDEAQVEEVEALRSIYGDALHLLSEEDDRPMILRLELPVEIEGGGPANLYINTSDGEVPAGAVHHLPPVALLVALPPHYPSEGKGSPVLAVEAQHMGSKQVADIQSELQELVDSRAFDEPGLFEWTCALRERLSQPPRLCLTDDGQRDPMETVLSLLSHDTVAKEQLRQTETQVCPVCFDELPGSRGLFLSCGHFGCRECLGQMARLHTSEAEVASLRCPVTDCREHFGFEVLKEILGPDSPALQKWEELSLRQCLDRMQDVVYCPRCDLEGTGRRIPCIQDEEHFARCEVCLFAFCGRCRAPYHPGIECTSADDRMEALEARAAGSSPEAAAARDELLTLRHLAKTTKNCPRCRVSIEKSEGCSKVHCRNCDVYFCWRCEKEITGYDHFATSECRLFDDEEIRRWNQRVNQVNQVDRAQARAHEARFLAQFVDRAEYLKQARQCPRCRTAVVRDGKNNHLRCYACLTSFCALCSEVLPKGKAGEHFRKPKPCPQHSDD